MNGVPVARTYDWHRAVVGNVSTEALALVLVLTNRMDADGTLPPRFTPSLETMSREMGYAPNSRRGIIRAMRELETQGFLQVQRGGGRKTTNKYRATVPLGATVADTPQKEAETVAETVANSGPDATHPTQTYSNPNPSTGGTASDEEQRRRAMPANQVLDAVMQVVPAADQQALSLDLARFNGVNRLRDTLNRLANAGLGQATVEELTATLIPGASPYAGSKHPASVMWARVRGLAQRNGIPTH